LPLALAWSLAVGGTSNYEQLLIPFIGISFEIFTMCIMIRYEDYARVYPADPAAAAVNRETKPAIFVSQNKNVMRFREFYQIFSNLATCLHCILDFHIRIYHCCTTRKLHT
jgi:hypothetical protein